MRAHHLLAEFSPGQDERAGVRGLPGEPRRVRARKRRGRSAPIVRIGLLRAAVSGGVYVGRAAISRAAQGSGGGGEDDGPRLPRRDFEDERDSGGDGAGEFDEAAAGCGVCVELEVLRTLALTGYFG